MSLVDDNENFGSDLVFNLDLIGFIETLAEKYEFDQEIEWSEYNEE